MGRPSNDVKGFDLVCVHMWEKRNDVASMGFPDRLKCVRCGSSWDKASEKEPVVVVARTTPI